MTTTDVDEIARGLTKAQQEAMLWIYPPKHDGLGQRRQHHRVPGEPAVAALDALCRKDLLVKQGGNGWPAFYTPLSRGLAVRAALLAGESAKGV